MENPREITELPLAAGEHVKRSSNAITEPSRSVRDNIINLWGPYNIPPMPGFNPEVGKWKGHSTLHPSQIAADERRDPLSREQSASTRRRF